MKQALKLTVGLVVLGTLAAMSAPVHAQTTANGPYYATPSWDQTLVCTTLANCPRFIVLSNFGGQAVLDRETGLVWEKSPSTTAFRWSDPDFRLTASGHCNTLTVGNRKGWRLPTIQELTSLMDPSVPSPGGLNPMLPAGHPFTNVQAQDYWSATTVASDANNAWAMFLASGDVGPAFGKGVPLFVWCVRGGQGVDPQ